MTTPSPRKSFRVVQTTDDIDVTDDVLAVFYDEPALDPLRVPRFDIVLDPRGGIAQHILAPGKEVLVYDEGRPVFPGIVEEHDDQDGESARLVVSGPHTGYHILRQARLLGYDANAGAAPGSRDSVPLFPWNPFVLRSEIPDAFGAVQEVAGVRPDDFFRALIGTRFIAQLDLRTNRHTKPAPVDTTAKLAVVKNANDRRPVLQRVAESETIIRSGSWDSVAYDAGFEDPVGAISTVDVEAYGTRGRVRQIVLPVTGGRVTSAIGKADFTTFVDVKRSPDVGAITHCNATGTGGYMAHVDELVLPDSSKDGLTVYLEAGWSSTQPCMVLNIYRQGASEERHLIYVEVTTNGDVKIGWNASNSATSLTSFTTSGVDFRGTTYRLVIQRDNAAGTIKAWAVPLSGASTLILDSTFGAFTTTHGGLTDWQLRIGASHENGLARSTRTDFLWKELRIWDYPVAFADVEALRATTYRNKPHGKEIMCCFFYSQGVIDGDSSRKGVVVHHEPVLEVTRHASHPSPTFVPVTLARAAAWKSSEFDKWSGTVDLSSNSPGPAPPEYDYGPHALHLDVAGAGPHTSAVGRWGGYYAFDGTSEFLERSATIFRQHEEMCLLVAIRPDTIRAQAIAQSAKDGGDDEFALKHQYVLKMGNDGRLTYEHRASGSNAFVVQSSTNLMTAGTDYVIILTRTYDAAGYRVRVWVNGVLWIERTFSEANRPFPADGQIFRIGKGPVWGGAANPIHFHGRIYEARFWDHGAITSAADAAKFNTSDTTYQQKLRGDEAAAWFLDDDVSLGDGEKNVLGFRVRIGEGREQYHEHGNADWQEPVSGTLAYIQAVAVAQRTGFPLTLGTVETYTPQDGEAEFVAGDFLGKSILHALSELRKTTRTPAEHPSRHWDLWCDADLKMHFRERRGVDRAREYSFREETLRTVSHGRFTDELAYEVVAMGAGRGEDRLVVRDKRPFASGGLYVPENDPAGATRKYGRLPRQLVYENPRVSRPGILKREARAYLASRMAPRQVVAVTIPAEEVPYFETGDVLHVLNPRTSTLANLRAVHARRGFTSDGKTLDVVLGEDEDRTDAQARDMHALASSGAHGVHPAAGVGAFTAQTVIFDSTNPNCAVFTILDGRRVHRVLLDIAQVPVVTAYRRNVLSSQNQWGATLFDGDANNGDTGAPVLGAALKFAVDAPLNSNSMPTDFEAAKHPMTLGSSTSGGASLRLDVTQYLTTDANGYPLNGIHRVWFKAPTPATGRGVRAVAVVAIVEYKEDD